MSLLSLLKRQTLEPPAEVIQAVCDLSGLSRERIASIQAERLSARALPPCGWSHSMNAQEPLSSTCQEERNSLLLHPGLMNRIEAVRRSAAWRSLDPPGDKLESRKPVNDELKSITHQQYSSRAGAQARTVYRGWEEGHL